tara:strand:+ start:11377 stop:11646 length:270 start_codon:yes stop_codon:yes gene_type:complete
MKRLWIILALIVLIKSDSYISIEALKQTWFDSLEEGTYFYGDDSSVIIKKKSNGNFTIESIYQDSFCIMEYDPTGNLVSASTGMIMASK